MIKNYNLLNYKLIKTYNDFINRLTAFVTVFILILKKIAKIAY